MVANLLLCFRVGLFLRAKWIPWWCRSVNASCKMLRNGGDLQLRVRCDVRLSTTSDTSCLPCAAPCSVSQLRGIWLLTFSSQSKLRPHNAGCCVQLGCPCSGRLWGESPMVLFSDDFPPHGALEQRKPCMYLKEIYWNGSPNPDVLFSPTLCKVTYLFEVGHGTVLENERSREEITGRVSDSGRWQKECLTSEC